MAASPPAPPSDESDADAPVVEVPTPPQTFELTLEEYCRRLSATESSVELVHGFYTDEVRVGHRKDFSEAFDAALVDFKDRPVA